MAPLHSMPVYVSLLASLLRRFMTLTLYKPFLYQRANFVQNKSHDAEHPWLWQQPKQSSNQSATIDSDSCNIVLITNNKRTNSFILIVIISLTPTSVKLLLFIWSATTAATRIIHAHTYEHSLHSARSSSLKLKILIPINHLKLFFLPRLCFLLNCSGND